jgi:hypothetical protein
MDRQGKLKIAFSIGLPILFLVLLALYVSIKVGL